MAEIEGLVRALREGDDEEKDAAADRLGDLAHYDAANRVLIVEAGAIPPLVELLRDGSADAKADAAWALRSLALNAANRVLIAEAGGIAPLVELLRDGDIYAKHWAADALRSLAYNNDANAVAIAVAVGFDAVVDLARGGQVHVDDGGWGRHASRAAKRKAARILLRKCLPRAIIPDVIAAATATFLV